MLLHQQIIDLLGKESNLTANQIADKLTQKPKSVKVILHRLNKQEKIVREKKAREQKTKAGPQNLYVYSVKSV